MSEKIEIDELRVDLKKLKTIGELLSDKSLLTDETLEECSTEIARISNLFEILLEHLSKSDTQSMTKSKIVSDVPFPTVEYLVLSSKVLYSIKYYFTSLRDLNGVLDDTLYLKLHDVSSQYGDFKIGNDLTDAIHEILMDKNVSDDVRDFLRSIDYFNDRVKGMYAQVLNGAPITGEYGHQEYAGLTEEKLVQDINYISEQGAQIKRISRFQ